MIVVEEKTMAAGPRQLGQHYKAMSELNKSMKRIFY